MATVIRTRPDHRQHLGRARRPHARRPTRRRGRAQAAGPPSGCRSFRSSRRDQPAGAVPARPPGPSKAQQAAQPGSRPSAASPSATTASGRARRSGSSPRTRSGRPCRRNPSAAAFPEGESHVGDAGARGLRRTPPRRALRGRARARARSGSRSATATSSSRCSRTPWGCTSTCSSGSRWTRRRSRSCATPAPPLRAGHQHPRGRPVLARRRRRRRRARPQDGPDAPVGGGAGPAVARRRL